MKTYQKGFAAVVTIVIALLIITATTFIYIKKAPPSETSSVLTKMTSAQGIVVASLKPGDLVKLPITIEGYLDGKGWYANEGEIGVVEVFDADGKSISNRVIVKTTSDWLKFPTYFQATVGEREMMSYIKTDTGVVKITANGAKDEEQLKSMTIPVRFK